MHEGRVGFGFWDLEQKVTKGSKRERLGRMDGWMKGRLGE
jgi:hypothetical protein